MAASAKQSMMPRHPQKDTPPKKQAVERVECPIRLPDATDEQKRRSSLHALIERVERIE